MSNTSSISELCDLIRKGKVAIFSGAGISKNSGLPLAKEVIRTIFEGCSHYSEDVDLLSETNLPMEYILETFSRYHPVFPIIDIFLDGKPSSSHHFIAQLHSSDLIQSSATTNIDILHEHAHDKLNLQIKPVLPNQYFSDDGNDSLFIKLHGTSKDRDSAMVTLSHIGKKRKSEWLEKSIHYLFSHGPHDVVIVFGYSCSDHFDINPIIKNIPQHKRKNVIYVDHNFGKNINELNEKMHSGLFSGYGGKVIEVDTDDLIRSLSEELELDFLPNSKSFSTSNWRQVIKNWAQEIKNKAGLSSLILGRIAYYGGLYSLAEKYYTDALNQSRDDIFRIQCNYFLSQITLENGRYIKADKFASHAVDLLNDITSRNNPLKQTDLISAGLHAHYAKALAQFDLGDNARKNKNKAVSHFEKSRFHLEQMKYYLTDDLGMESFKVSYHLLGGLLNSHWRANPKQRKDHELKAIKHYEDCLELTKRYGDIAQEADCHNDYATLLTKMKQFLEAEEHLLNALEIYEKLNDKGAISISLVNLSATRYGLGNTNPINYHISLAVLNEAIKLKKEVGQAKISKNRRKLWYIKRKINQNPRTRIDMISNEFDTLNKKFQNRSNYASNALSQYKQEIFDSVWKNRQK